MQSDPQEVYCVVVVAGGGFPLPCKVILRKYTVLLLLQEEVSPSHAK